MRPRLVVLSAIVTLAGAILGATQLGGQVSRPGLIGTCAAFFGAGAAMASALRSHRDARRRPPSGPL